MARYQAVRGTFDVLPNEISAWQRIEGLSRDLAHRFGYREIRTPLFEEADLFTRGMGVMSGLIEKELWTFNDKFGQKLALRTDATTGIIRAYQQNKLYNGKLPLKVFYLAPVFLLGKEGEERSRQSHQFGFEAIGSDNPALDAEVIALAAAFCDAVGIEDYSIRLNSLGGKDCRPPYLQKLRDYFGTHSARLCATCKRKYKANPDWVLSCEEADCKALSQVAPTIFGLLTNGAKTDFAALREYLQEMELPIELDPRVVRDSEYYNGPVFEIRSKGIGIGFGGRYDGLVEKLGGKATPAVGFAFCLESVLQVLNLEEQQQEALYDVLLRPEGPESAKLLVPLLFTLRQRGVTAELDYSYSNGKRHKESLTGFSYLVTLDESNAFRGNAILKDLEDNSEEKVPVARLRNRVLHLAGVSGEDERDGSKSGRKRLRRGRKRNEEEREKVVEVAETAERDETSESRGKRSRARRRGRDGAEREPRKEVVQPEQESAPEEPPQNRSPKSRRSERENPEERESRRENSRESNRENTRDRDQPQKRRPRESTDSEASGGKAIVPVFGLGGGSALTSEPPKKTAVAAKKMPPRPATAGTGGGLNWSILPGKDTN